MKVVHDEKRETRDRDNVRLFATHTIKSRRGKTKQKREEDLY